MQSKFGYRNIIDASLKIWSEKKESAPSEQKLKDKGKKVMQGLITNIKVPLPRSPVTDPEKKEAIKAGVR